MWLTFWGYRFNVFSVKWHYFWSISRTILDARIAISDWKVKLSAITEATEVIDEVVRNHSNQAHS
jgi:hypothetical protein